MNNCREIKTDIYLLQPCAAWMLNQATVQVPLNNRAADRREEKLPPV